MASPGEAFNLVSERKAQLRKVFTEFEAKKFSLGRIGATWKDIEEHFKEIEICLEKTHEAYKAKEKAFEARMKSVQAELDKHAGEVSAKEQASVRRVQSQKDAAIAAIREQKRKLADEKRSWEAEKQRVESGGAGTTPSNKETYSKKSVDTAKASLSKDTQPKKNAEANTTISKGAHAKRDTHADSLSAKKETQTSIALMHMDASPAKKETSTKQDPTTEDEKVSASSKTAGERPASHVQKGSVKGNGIEDHTKVPREPRPKLKIICQNMDYDGFRKLIVENQKELKTLQDEVPSALKLCNDPAELVLKTLEIYLDLQKKGKLELGKDDCYVCTMLVESLSEAQGDKPIVSAKVRKSAKILGDKWKALLKLEGQFGFNLVLVGRSFLQFTAAFGLSSEYNQDELCEIVAKVARRKHTPIVFRSLKLSEKAPDVIEKLIKEGKEIAAVSFASEFNLLERFPPAPLLKSHIKEAKKAAKTILKNGSNTLAAQNEALQKELAALKAVTEVVKEYKLEDHYTLDKVEKQLATLEKTKADRKRAATASKAQLSKKSRTDDGSPSCVRSASPSPEKPLQGIHDRDLYDGARIPPHGAVGMAEFDRRPLGEFDRRALEEYDRRSLGEFDRRRLGLYDAVGEFDRRRLGLYDAAYGASTANPMLHNSYVNPSLDLGYGSSTHGGQPSSISGYGYSSALSSLGMGGFKPYL